MDDNTECRWFKPDRKPACGSACTKPDDRYVGIFSILCGSKRKTQKGYKDGQRVSATTGQKDISHRDAYAAGYPDGERCETTIRDKQVAGTQMPEGVSAGDGISKEQLKEFISEMRDTLKKSLNLDDEQLDDLLAQLNLNVLQLLQPENLQNLLLTAAGKEPLDLVTDSSLADLLQNMQQSLDVLAGKLEINAQDMDSEQMTELLKQLSESEGETVYGHSRRVRL